MATAGCAVQNHLLVIVDDDPSERISTQRPIRSFGFLRKPFNERVLLNAIQTALRREAPREWIGATLNRLDELVR
ncbi:MAG TPA: hypothetical protein VN957_22890 [Chthoniobacterales bacterium]|jgi:hypothetical protein|nr:hypothetical protein [Chthoniobacterales bacterium]